MIVKQLESGGNIPLIVQFLEKHFPGKGSLYEPYLWKAIANPDMFVLVGEDREGSIWGVLIASYSLWNGQRVAQVHTCVTTRAYKEGLLALQEWAKLKGIPKIIGFTTRNPRLFERKYGFKCLSHVIGLDIKD